MCFLLNILKPISIIKFDNPTKRRLMTGLKIILIHMKETTESKPVFDVFIFQYIKIFNF